MTSIISPLLFLFMQTTPPQLPPPTNAKPLTILVLNGKTGKPIPGNRLLVFGGKTPTEVTRQTKIFELTSDSKGIAVLNEDVPLMQVFVDYLGLCEHSANSTSFSTEAVRARGLVGENTCGKFKVEAVPGQLTIFAREKSFFEKMKQ